MNKPKRRKKSQAQSWPYIVFSDRENAWRVDARTKDGGSRRFFETKAEAEGFAQKCRIAKGNAGTSSFGNAELSKFGWTVHRAIDFALVHLRLKAQSKPVIEAITALLDFKRERVGKIRLSDIENRLLRFSGACEGKTVAEITHGDIMSFLDTIPHPTTRNDYRKEIVMLWNFCRARKWVVEALDKTHVPREIEPEKSRTILTVEQTISLMKASIDDDIRVLNAMILFGGLRREEVEKLHWAAVDFKTGHIEVSAEISKVSMERFAPMHPNLKAWLLPFSKKTGPIISRNLMHPLRATWKRAKIYPWPQDAHRHSYISYRRTLVGDPQTALEAGTSERIIKKHYKRPVTAKDARRFFSIKPSTENSRSS